MTLAELRTYNAAADWRRLTPAQQAAVGQSALSWLVAQLVAGDDGSETTAQDRDTAQDIAGRHLDQLELAVEAALPHIAWWSQPLRLVAAE